MSPLHSLKNFPRRLAKHLLENVISKRGGVVLSHAGHAGLLATRAAAIAELTALELQGLKPGLTGVLFSKDRALQVHTLLRSYFDLVQNPAPLTVLYNASSPAHAKAYDDVAALFNKAPAPVTFVREEKKFRVLLPAVLQGVKTRNVFFLVDDIIFIRPLDLKLAAAIDPLKETLCLRLSPHVTYSYMMHRRNRQPVFKPAAQGTKAEPLVSFRWYEGTDEWAYPYSVDGNIFSTAEMRVLARLGSYKAPNTFEGALMSFADVAKDRPGLCYGVSKLVNLPLNLVQTELMNNRIIGSNDAEALLKAWQNGQTFDTTALRTHTPRSPHEAHALPLVPRKVDTTKAMPARK